MNQMHKRSLSVLGVLLVYASSLHAAPPDVKLLAGIELADIVETVALPGGGEVNVHQLGAGLPRDIVSTIIVDGNEISQHLLGANIYLPGGGSDYDWWYGCTPTSAGMMMGHYDRHGYNQQSYCNAVAGGVAEVSSHGGGGSSLLGNNAIASPGHVADFWVGYGQSGNDPLASGRTLPAEFDCLADYMGTSQDSQGNSDGGTLIYNYTNGAPLPVSDAVYHGIQDSSGMYGIYEYMNYCGYQQTNPSAETNIFNQYIVEQGLTYGFSRAQYVAEIDAGRPVMIHVEGHSMCGVGYDNSSSNIYVMDTWNAGPHAMPWAGTYSGLQHYGVTVVQPDGVGAVDNAWGGSCDAEYVPGGFAALGDTTGLPAGAPCLEATLDISNFDDGGDGVASLLFHYSDAELADAGILDESALRMYWWDGDSWEFDGTGTFYAGAPTGVLGDYGVNTAGNYAWINVDHGSEWALSVPEPSTLGLLCMGAAGLLACVGRRRRRG